MAQTNPAAKACANLETDLVLYHYGDLSGSAKAQIEAHLEQCDGCRGYIKDTQTLATVTVKSDQPPPVFWQNYAREMRHKLTTLGEKQPWWRRAVTVLQPWMVPAFGTTAVVALALAFTLGRGVWQTNETPPEVASLMEVLPMAEHLEFYANMEVVDSLDLLEYMATSTDDSA
jgi:predicted anti-sigma-YlaC factor YlaD